MPKTKYHVGCGATAIYAGTGTLWRNKSEVTVEALSAAAQFLLQYDLSFLFTNLCDGRRYRLSVIEVSKEETEDPKDAD